MVKARNFLVFQGDVESLASKSQDELTAVLEQVSGSSDHKKEYDKLKTAKDQAEAASLLAYQKKKGLAAQRGRCRSEGRGRRVREAAGRAPCVLETCRFLVSRSYAMIDQTDQDES